MQIRHVLTIVVLHLIMLSNASFTAETIIPKLFLSKSAKCPSIRNYLGAVNKASIETALTDEIVQLLLQTSKVELKKIVTHVGTTVVIMVVSSSVGHATK